MMNLLLHGIGDENEEAAAPAELLRPGRHATRRRSIMHGKMTMETKINESEMLARLKAGAVLLPPLVARVGG